jgi:hypothetical protein
MKHATRIGRIAGLAVGLGIGAALAATPGIASADDFQISIDGIDLFPTAGNTATATSGMGDFAIAIGNGADASALGGPFDSAFANGTDSHAATAEGYFDSASAIGDGSKVESGFGNFDTALGNGTDSGALAGGDVINNTLIPANFDFASAWGPDAQASAGDVGSTTSSSGDVATVFDPFGTVGSVADAGIGNSDLAAVFGDMLTATATGGNFMVDILPSL